MSWEGGKVCVCVGGGGGGKGAVRWQSGNGGRVVR